MPTLLREADRGQRKWTHSRGAPGAPGPPGSGWRRSSRRPLVVRVALMPFHAYLPGGSMDEHFWTAWMQAIHERGVLNVFTHDQHQLRRLPVGALGALDRLRLGRRLLRPSGRRAAPPREDAVRARRRAAHRRDVARDGGACVARRGAQARALALTAAAVIAFQPAVLYDSAVWAQTDASISVAMLAALLMARARAVPAGRGPSGPLGFRSSRSR